VSLIESSAFASSEFVRRNAGKRYARRQRVVNTNFPRPHRALTEPSGEAAQGGVDVLPKEDRMNSARMGERAVSYAPVPE
jgi:hypothetical protein